MKVRSNPSILLNWLFFFIIWPFAAFVAALKRVREPYAKAIFWLFCVYFGFVFVFPASVEGTADSARYVQKLVEAHEKALSLNALTQSFYNQEEGIVDIYQPLATWLVAIFTDDPKWLYALFGAVFGIFYIKNIWLLVARLGHKSGFFLFLLLLAFTLTNPIWNINGVRMWTAAQVFLYGGLSYFLEQKKSGLFWIAASALFHFSFLLPIILFYGYLILPKSIHVYFLFFIITAFINELDINIVRDAISFIPEIFQKKIDPYTNPDYVLRIQEANENYSWHVHFAQLSLRIVIYVLATISYTLLKYWEKEDFSVKQVYMLALLLGGVANLTSHIPSGGRFMTIANGFFFAAFVLIFQQAPVLRKTKLLCNTIIPLIVFWLLFAIRVGFDYMGFMVILGNPLLALAGIEQTPLISFVKSVF